MNPKIKIHKIFILDRDIPSVKYTVSIKRKKGYVNIQGSAPIGELIEIPIHENTTDR